MSKVETFLNKYKKSLKGNKNPDEISDREELLSKEIEKLSNIKQFYELNLENILSIVEKVDFEEIESNHGIQGCISIIQKLIQETTKTYPEQSILLLNSIHISRFSYSFDVNSCISIIKEFIHSDICCILSDLLNPQLVTRNYEYELSLKDKEI